MVNGILLLKNGIISTGESQKYISEAQAFIETGRVSKNNFLLYFTQIGLLAFSIKLKLGFVFTVAVQLFFNLLAIFSFFGMSLKIFKRKITALIASIFLLLNLPYQEFNTMLQTESLFYSFTLLYSCYLIQIERLSLKHICCIVLWLLVISVTRPTGLLFIPPTFVYLFFNFFRKMNSYKKMSLLILIAFFFIYALDKALGSGGEFDFMLPFRNEEIICGVPVLPASVHIETTSTPNSVYGLIYYISHNPGQFTRLAWLKTLAFFGLYRSYYSSAHNIYLILFFYPFYIGMIFGIPAWSKSHSYKFLYFFLVITMTWLTAILTCDDWHNRFYLSISPYLILIGMSTVSVIIRNNKDRNQDTIR